MTEYIVLSDANPEDASSGFVEAIVYLNSDIEAAELAQRSPVGTSVCKRNESGKFVLVSHKREVKRGAHTPAR